MYICPSVRLCITHVSSEKCSKSTKSRSLQRRFPFGSLFCILLNNFAIFYVQNHTFFPDVTLWTPFWIPKMLPFKQFCNFSCPKNGPKKVGHTDTHTDRHTDRRTDAHQNFEALLCKSPFGTIKQKVTGRQHHDSMI